MWESVKTTLSAIGLFIMIVIVMGIYFSLVQGGDSQPEDDSYQTVPNQATTTNNSTSSDFIDINTDNLVPEESN